MLQVVTASNIACCIRNGKWNLPKLISILARVRCRLVRLYGQTLWIGKWGWGLGKWVGLGEMEMENREPAEVHSTAIIGV